MVTAVQENGFKHLEAIIGALGKADQYTGQLIMSGVEQQMIAEIYKADPEEMYAAVEKLSASGKTEAMDELTKIRFLGNASLHEEFRDPNKPFIIWPELNGGLDGNRECAKWVREMLAQRTNESLRIGPNDLVMALPESATAYLESFRGFLSQEQFIELIRDENLGDKTSVFDFMVRSHSRGFEGRTMHVVGDDALERITKALANGGRLILVDDTLATGAAAQDWQQAFAQEFGNGQPLTAKSFAFAAMMNKRMQGGTEALRNLFGGVVTVVDVKRVVIPEDGSQPQFLLA